MSATKTLTSKSDIKAFLDKYDTFLFDCDGVIWQGYKLIPNVLEALDMLHNSGKRLLYVTNNSTKSRADYVQIFQKLGLKASIEEIFSSSYATAVYLRKVINFPPDKKVYVIGQSGIIDELAEEGIQSFGGMDDNENMIDGDFDSIQPDPAVGAVVCGLDFRINYKKLAKAYTYLSSNPDCLFLLTNSDSTFPTHGRRFPGAGAISSGLTYSLKREPDAILGKPYKPMMDSIVARYELDKLRTVMIGDRLDTDVAFGINGGIDTCCVSTGVATEDEIIAETVNRPTYYIEGVGRFVEVLDDNRN